MDLHGVQRIDETLFNTIAERAISSPRLRMNHNFHASPSDNPHRFLNVLLENAYVRPHRHLNPPKPETFLILDGTAAVLIFDAAGNVTARYELGQPTASGHLWGVDLAPGVWHTVFSLSPRAVCFEVKPGPWDPATDKDFAAWAPDENDPARYAYLQRLKAISS